MADVMADKNKLYTYIYIIINNQVPIPNKLIQIKKNNGLHSNKLKKLKKNVVSDRKKNGCQK